MPVLCANTHPSIMSFSNILLEDKGQCFSENLQTVIIMTLKLNASFVINKAIESKGREKDHELNHIQDIDI